MEEYLTKEKERSKSFIRNEEESLIKVECRVDQQIPSDDVKNLSSLENDFCSMEQQNTSIELDKTLNDKTCEHDERGENADSADKVMSQSAASEVKEIRLRDLRRLSNAIVKEVIENAQQLLEERFSEREDSDAVLETINNSSGVLQQELPVAHETSPSDRNRSSNKDQQGERMLNANYDCKTESQKLTPKQQVSKSSEKVIEELDADTICGIGSFRPRWMQKWARAEVYVILYSIIGILHGSYYSYLIGTLSTLEKRFAFRSKISGTIMMLDEVTPLFLGVFLGYLGGKVHRPRLLAAGMLLSGGCSVASAAPYFIYGPAQHLVPQSVRNETGTEYCRDITVDSCVTDERPPTVAAVLFLMLGSFMKGFGNLAYYTVGLVYMDDNSKKRNTPIYLAVALSLRLLGPLVGFLMSSAFLKINENPFEDPGYGPEDPRWIGAWWLGFLVQGILLFVFTIPILLFPRRLPSHGMPIQEGSKHGNMREMIADLLAAMKRLSKNPLFIVVVLNDLMIIYGHFGHFIMLPKYMENQFRISASDASLISGPPALCSVIVFTLLGGFLMWRYKPSAKFLLAGMALTELLFCMYFLVLMIPKCSPVEMSHYGETRNGLVLDSECNKECDCSKTAFTPFCGPDGRTTFFSPCFAGCFAKIEFPDQTNTSVKQVFGNCSCVSGRDGLPGANITEGFCQDDSCWSQAMAYSSILIILSANNGLVLVAYTIILLRSVNSEDKSIALGTFEAISCLLGFIPFPITYGAIVDSACLIWEESCGESGNCWFYDMAKYNYQLHGASTAFCLLATLLLVVMYILNARVRSLYEEQDGEGPTEKPIKLDTMSEAAAKL